MFTQQELSILAEAVNFKLEKGTFGALQRDASEFVFNSSNHFAELLALGDKVVAMQEAEQSDEDDEV